MAIAKEWRKEQMEYRMMLGEKWEGDNFLFIQWNGRQMHPDSPYSAFKKLIERYNNSITDESNKLPNIPLHGLRHTSATLLISQNVDIRTVAGRLGHAQTSTTLDIYAHSLKKLDEKASDTLAELLQKKA
jgi:integrase